MPQPLKINNVPEGEDITAIQRNVDFIYKKLQDRAAMVLTDQTERDFYIERARAYLKDFPMLNPSSDIDDLHTLLIEMIFQNRCVVTGRIDEDYNNSVKRTNGLKESIATRRLDRKKMPEKQEDFARVIQEIFNTNEGQVKEQDVTLQDEEKKFMEEKAERDKAFGLTDN